MFLLAEVGRHEYMSTGRVNQTPGGGWGVQRPATSRMGASPIGSTLDGSCCGARRSCTQNRLHTVTGSKPLATGCSRSVSVGNQEACSEQSEQHQAALEAVKGNAGQSIT